MDTVVWPTFRSVHLLWLVSPLVPLPHVASFVLPNHMLLELSIKAPMETNAVLACCQPIPPLVRVYAQDILTVRKHDVDVYSHLCLLITSL